MAKLTISAAAKRAGVARQTMYKNYINTGKITVDTDERGNKCVDTSEIIRVFGVLHYDSPDSVTQQEIRHKVTPDLHSIIASLEMEVKLLREQLADQKELTRQGQDREQQLNQHIERLTVLRQLEHKPAGWFARLLGK